MLLIPCLVVTEFQLILQPGISGMFLLLPGAVVYDSDQCSARFFDLRTRGLLAFVAAIIEVMGTLSFGCLLDYSAWPRPTSLKFIASRLEE